MEAYIKFDSPRSVFYPGQVITGTLEIELESPLTFSVIYVKFFGEAKVGWIESESETVNGHKRYKTVEYASREEYVKGSQLLAGSYGTISHLNPGKYKYPFSYRLPSGIPSSFRGSRGAIEFYAAGHVEFQGKNLFSYDIRKAFDVVAPLDLNHGNAEVRAPIELEFEEVYSCACFCTNPVSVRVRMPFSAYCPGQTIPVAVSIDNDSSVEITSMLFELVTRARYRSQRPIAEYVQPEEALASAKRGSVMSGNKRTFQVDLRVPDLIAPNLELCSVIDVGYFFRVTIKLSGCNEPLQDEAEIRLGLVPLQESVEGEYSHPMEHSLPVGPIAVPADAGQRVDSVNAPEIGFVEQAISPSQNYQIGFIPQPASTSPMYPTPGQYTNPYGMPMKCFTPPGVYPYPGQNNVNAPSAPQL